MSSQQSGLLITKTPAFVKTTAGQAKKRKHEKYELTTRLSAFDGLG
jgi:hypothetical protein